jgi:hypothetical protein
MKLTTIFGSAIAAVGLAACGSTVAPTVSPTLALTVAPTVAPTPTATPALTPTAISIPTPSPSDSPSPNASASPSPNASPSASPSPCVVTTEGPPGTGSCETPPVVSVTACDGYGYAAGGGEISWSGADSVDSFWIWPPDDGGYPIKLYQGSGNLPLTPSSGSYGPLPAGYYTYQFFDNTNEFGGPFSGSFTILNCPMPTTPPGETPTPPRHAGNHPAP